MSNKSLLNVACQNCMPSRPGICNALWGKKENDKPHREGDEPVQGIVGIVVVVIIVIVVLVLLGVL